MMASVLQLGPFNVDKHWCTILHKIDINEQVSVSVKL
jgi:hypothetical protein